MQIQRTVIITLEYDCDLKRTLEVFQRIQQQLSVPCYNNGKPLPALALHREYYHEVKGVLNAQMICTAIRLVAGAYASAKSNKKPATRPFLFRKAHALFLVGKKGRDASFREDGKLSLRGVRKRHAFTCPHCGHSDHADINAAYNIRDRFTQFRLSGLSSISPEALSLSRDEGKPSS